MRIFTTKYDELAVLDNEQGLCYGLSDTVKDALEAMYDKQVRYVMVNVTEAAANCADVCTVLYTGAEVLPPAEFLCSSYRLMDMKDILTKLVDQQERLAEHYRKESAHGVSERADSAGTWQGSENGEFSLDDVKGARCHEVANISQLNNFVPRWSTDSVFTIAETFKSCARVPIFKYDGATKNIKFLRVFSATDFFHLVTHESALTDSPTASTVLTQIMEMSIEQAYRVAGKALSRPVVVHEAEDTLTAAKKILSSGFTALPVVGAEEPRKALGVLSVSDFRGFVLERLTLPAGRTLHDVNALAFVSQVRQQECLKSRYPSISCCKSAQVNSVVNRMVAANVQRVFIVDDDGHLEGVFSRTDLGRIFAQIMLINPFNIASE